MQTKFGNSDFVGIFIDPFFPVTFAEDILTAQSSDPKVQERNQNFEFEN